MFAECVMKMSRTAESAGRVKDTVARGEISHQVDDEMTVGVFYNRRNKTTKTLKMQKKINILI